MSYDASPKDKSSSYFRESFSGEKNGLRKGKFFEYVDKVELEPIDFMFAHGNYILVLRELYSGNNGNSGKKLPGTIELTMHELFLSCTPLFGLEALAKDNDIAKRNIRKIRAYCLRNEQFELLL